MHLSIMSTAELQYESSYMHPIARCSIYDSQFYFDYTNDPWKTNRIQIQSLFHLRKSTLIIYLIIRTKTKV